MLIQKKYSPAFAGKATQASNRAERLRVQADSTETLLRNLDNQIAEAFKQRDSNAAALDRLQREALGN